MPAPALSWPPIQHAAVRRAHAAVTASDPGGKTGHVGYCSGRVVARPGGIGTFSSVASRQLSAEVPADRSYQQRNDPCQDEDRRDCSRKGIAVAFVGAAAEIDDRPSAEAQAWDDCCDADLAKHRSQS